MKWYLTLLLNIACCCASSFALIIIIEARQTEILAVSDIKGKNINDIREVTNILVADSRLLVIFFHVLLLYVALPQLVPSKFSKFGRLILGCALIVLYCLKETIVL